MGLLAAVAVVLHRHTQQEDFTIGIPMWGRNHAQLEHLMGFFVNTLPIRVRFEGRQSFRQLLAQVRATSIEAYANQELPFEQIVASQKIARDPARNPLVQVMLQVASMPLPSLHGMLGLSVERLPVPPGRARFDLEFFIRQDEGRGMYGELTYDADRFAGDGIERLVGHLLTLLTSLLRDPDAPTSGLTLLTAPERQRIAAWQCGATRDGPHDVVHRLFERQAARTPDAVALIYDDRSLTYADLEARANRLAHHLVAHGAGSDTLVAVCLDRSVELMVSVLAILKSGAAYLPLDPAWPALRAAPGGWPGPAARSAPLIPPGRGGPDRRRPCPL
jgi:non-ribosomal peptide synthetase component F